MLSLPPDLKLSGAINLSLTGEGDLSKVSKGGTTDCKYLEVNAAFLNKTILREES